MEPGLFFFVHKLPVPEPAWPPADTAAMVSLLSVSREAKRT